MKSKKAKIVFIGYYNPKRGWVSVDFKRNFKGGFLMGGIQNLSKQPIKVLVPWKIGTFTVNPGRTIYGALTSWQYCGTGFMFSVPCKVKILAGYAYRGEKPKWTDYAIIELGKRLDFIKVNFIDKENTYFIIDNKKCYPGTYKVYEGNSIPFVITLDVYMNYRLMSSEGLSVGIYDKISKRFIFGGDKKIKEGHIIVKYRDMQLKVKGHIEIYKDMQLEVRLIQYYPVKNSRGEILYWVNRVIDRYG